MAIKTEEPQATFDYSNYSRADQKKGIALQLDLQYISAQLDENAQTMTRAEYKALKAEYHELVDEIERVTLAYVTYVPPEWFVSSAPKDISVNTPDWWLYVQADKLRQIKKAANEARQPGEMSGNSEKH